MLLKRLMKKKLNLLRILMMSLNVRYSLKICLPRKRMPLKKKREYTVRVNTNALVKDSYIG
jgi:hypothetical protein|uniref:Uncharacterized protein n=1 Tax=Bacteriophage sp. TaxID=38018 RepID=A0A8D9PF01_9VIRU|nr:MAG TPA: hypothetical protein [Bacteriophage sp.]